MIDGSSVEIVARWLHFHRLLENRLRTNLRYLFNSRAVTFVDDVATVMQPIHDLLDRKPAKLTQPTNSFPFTAVSLTTFIARQLYVSFEIMHDIELS